MSSFWTNKQHEETLRFNGYMIPEYPVQGDVIKDGMKVGTMDNFNGLTITDDQSTNDIRKLIPTAGYWK